MILRRWVAVALVLVVLAPMPPIAQSAEAPVPTVTSIVAAEDRMKVGMYPYLTATVASADGRSLPPGTLTIVRSPSDVVASKAVSAADATLATWAAGGYDLGEYEFVATYESSSGGMASSASVIVTYADLDPPGTTVRVWDWYQTSHVAIEFTTEEGATSECRIDDEPYAPCTSPWTRTMADGVYRIGIVSTDSAGNRAQYDSGGTFRVDTTPPTGTFMINGGAAVTNDPVVIIEVDGHDDLQPIWRVYLSQVGTVEPDGRLASDYYASLSTSGTGHFSFDLANPFTGGTSTDGLKTVYLQFEGSPLGERSAVVERSITLDRSTPTLTPATYTPLAPVRILDTRFDAGLAGTFRANIPRTFQVAGRRNIPFDAIAITGNLTVVSQTAGGYVSLTPTATANPTTSTLNMPHGDTRANNVTLRLSNTGSLSAVYKAPAGNTTALILDVTGYFRANDGGARYFPFTPTRLLDTRISNGLTGAFQARQARTFTVTGRGGVPGHAVAVTGNLTVTGQTGPGYVTLASSLPKTPPSTSTLNFPAGDTRANGVTIGLGPNGSLTAYYHAAIGRTAHLAFDVTGYFTMDSWGSRFVPLEPVRALDTRSGTGLSGRFTSPTWRTLGLGWPNGIPPGSQAITGNITIVGQTHAGHVSVALAASDPPTTSTLNAPLGDVRANGLTSPLPVDRKLALVYRAKAGATTHLVLDVTGYFR